MVKRNTNQAVLINELTEHLSETILNDMRSRKNLENNLQTVFDTLKKRNETVRKL